MTQIKKYLKKIMYLLIQIFAKIFVYLPLKSFLVLYSNFITHITSEYIIKSLRQCGKNPKVFFPIKVHGLQYVSIGDNFSSFARLQIEAFDRHLDDFYTPEIAIGDNVSINYDCHIACINKIYIGNNVLIASKVFITDHYHGDIDVNSLKTPPSMRKLTSKGPVIIKDNVWIGEGVTILPNVIIGENSIIGANSVVTKDIPPNSVAVGSPARIIKKLNENE